MEISTVTDLEKLRMVTNLNEVVLNFDDRVFKGNLALYAIKYGIWALLSGGKLEIKAHRLPDSMILIPHRLPFQLLVQLAARAVAGWGKIVYCNLTERRIVLERTLPVMNDGWSAGVIFSGQASELPQLKKCLNGLLSQSALAESKDIVVCGPADAEYMVPVGNGVRYLSYETPYEAGRFLVCRKKNFLLAALRNEKALICHTRVVLRPDSLASIPREFDLITPRIWVNGFKSKLPYLDVGFIGFNSVVMIASDIITPICYNRQSWRNLLKKHFPYIDGGFFCVRRSLAKHVILGDLIAWGEAEDVEWCMRLLFSGNAIELADNAHADSMSCKSRYYVRWGHLSVYRILSQLWRLIRTIV